MPNTLLLKQLSSLSPETVEYVLPFFEYGTTKSKEHILTMGNINKYMYFITEGIMQESRPDEDGRILDIMTVGEWVCQVESFFCQTPSENNIEALTNTKYFKISYDNLQKISDENLEVAKFIYKLNKSYMIIISNKVNIRHAKTVKERFELFEKTYPLLKNQLKQITISSFLNCTPEQLSRERSKRRSGN